MKNMGGKHVKAHVPETTVMKETHDSLKRELLDINKTLSSLISAVQNRTDLADPRFDDWQKACGDVHQQITEEVVRVAVIGPVKSGKSTFVNSLFKGDYLKRGAGVVTSIVTRIRAGRKLKAVLFFKSWDEVNADIQQALLMLPSWKQQADDKPFDIRREKDRQSLQFALERLSDDVLITDGTRNTNTVLLSLYLNGYNTVFEKISADSMTTKFSGSHFAEHRTFVGDDTLAVYLKDIELEINKKSIDRSIEIADCQGSDSPNPLHLAMIQDYLMRTHFIVYVISSRTGLRQADIRFLSIIKKMGILENILFVVNIDFSEHESQQDLIRVIDKAREELALVRPDPDVYAFSALFNLFRDLSGELSKKDSLRLDYWSAEKDLVTFSNHETGRFLSSLNGKLTQERVGLLLKNHLERMSIMASGIERWGWMNKELLVKDVDGASAIIKKIERHLERMAQIKSLMNSTFSGATEKIMKELKSETDRFFNYHPGGVMEQTMTFVTRYSVVLDSYQEKLAVSGFSNTLHFIFQEFNQALDTFMAETINPALARFVGKIEDKLKKYLESVAGPFTAMASDAVAELRAAISEPGMKMNTSALDGHNLLDLDTIKRVAGLKLPSSTAALQYSARVRTEAVMRLGVYSAVKLVKKVLKKPLKNEHEEQMHALADGVKSIKRETEKSIVFHFENYRENFKFQYVARLIAASSEYLHKRLSEQFQSYGADLTALEKIVKKKGSDREDMIHFLDSIAGDTQRLQGIIDKSREKVQRCVGH